MKCRKCAEPHDACLCGTVPTCGRGDCENPDFTDSGLCVDCEADDRAVPKQDPHPVAAA